MPGGDAVRADQAPDPLDPESRRRSRRRCSSSPARRCAGRRCARSPHGPTPSRCARCSLAALRSYAEGSDAERAAPPARSGASEALRVHPHHRGPRSRGRPELEHEPRRRGTRAGAPAARRARLGGHGRPQGPRLLPPRRIPAPRGVHRAGRLPGLGGGDARSRGSSSTTTSAASIDRCSSATRLREHRGAAPDVRQLLPVTAPEGAAADGPSVDFIFEPSPETAARDAAAALRRDADSTRRSSRWRPGSSRRAWSPCATATDAARDGRRT